MLLVQMSVELLQEGGTVARGQKYLSHIVGDSIADIRQFLSKLSIYGLATLESTKILLTKTVFFCLPQVLQYQNFPLLEYVGSFNCQFPSFLMTRCRKSVPSA